MYGVHRIKAPIRQRLFYLGLAVTLGLAGIVALLEGLDSRGVVQAAETAELEPRSFLPVIQYPSSPAGSYDCLEYEFGLIWTSEIITLHVDGSSEYLYNPPYSGYVTGTWSFTPTINEVGFTNFRWTTATYRFPDSMWASRYLPQVDFEIAVFCQRR